MAKGEQVILIKAVDHQLQHMADEYQNIELARRSTELASRLSMDEKFKEAFRACIKNRIDEKEML